MIKIQPKMFSGTSKVFDGSLEDVLRGLAQNQAQAAIAAATITDLTDNSGGVPAASLVTPTSATAFDAGTTDAVAKAEVETTLGVVRQNVRRLIAQTNVILDTVPAFADLVDSIGGTAPDATLLAVDDTMTGTSQGGTLATAAGFNTTVAALHDRMAQLTRWINLLATAVGVTHVGGDLTGSSATGTFAAVTVDVGTTTDAGSLSKVQGDAVLDTLADNIATLNAKLAEITAVTPTLGVVAA